MRLFSFSNSTNRFRFAAGLFLTALLFCCLASLNLRAESITFTNKTLVVWAAPDNLEQRGGSAFTIDMANPDAFDGAVFGELNPNVWMPGSSCWARTNQDQKSWPRETAAGEFVRIVIVYHDNFVDLYRNDELVDSHECGSLQTFNEYAHILIGPRHLADTRNVFVGKVKDARVYPFALSADQVKALEPGKPLKDAEPWVWWNFADGVYDKTGHYNNITLKGDTKIEDGALVIGDGDGAFIASKTDAKVKNALVIPDKWSPDGPVPQPVVQSARALREKIMADPYRPRWHFATPEDNGMPGDPNGCYWVNGEYHLMYLYGRAGSGFCWGHISSIDLVHWRHHPDAIGPSPGEEGCFSGGGFCDEDGQAYITYWQLWQGGIGLAKSSYPYDQWTKVEENPIIPSTQFGAYHKETPEGTVLFGSADPSNIWKKDGKYYVLTGNYYVLHNFGMKEDSPANLQGDRLDLFESTDLKTWTYKGVFYERNPEWTAIDEDDMCPSFLPLSASPEGGEFSGKHLLLFISHNRGCQYYVGTYDTDKDHFFPESHGRMTNVDNTYFAPEALVDGKGRQIMWAWIIDNRKDEMALHGWSGIYGVPRVLWCGEDGTLRMRPVPELEILRYGEKTFENLTAAPEKPAEISGFPGDSFELNVSVSAEEVAKAAKVGLTVREDKAKGEKTLVYYDTETKELVFDSTKSGPDGRPAVERLPFALNEGEDLELRVFVDTCVVEVFANDRQAIGRRVYPTDPENSLGVSLFSEGGSVKFDQVKAWEMKPSNPY